MKKLGNPAAARPRYDFSSDAQSSCKLRPLGPMIGKGGRYETSKPVAQMRMSMGYSFPSSQTTPFSVNAFAALKTFETFTFPSA